MTRTPVDGSEAPGAKRKPRCGSRTRGRWADAAYALSRRLHRQLSRATIVAVFGVVLVQVLFYRQFPAYAIWLGILLWMRDRHPRVLDETTPLGARRKLVAGLLLGIFLLSFILIPIYFD